MVLEKLNEALADHSGRAQNSDLVFGFHSRRHFSVQEGGHCAANYLRAGQVGFRVTRAARGRSMHSSKTRRNKVLLLSSKQDHFGIASQSVMGTVMRLMADAKYRGRKSV